MKGKTAQKELQRTYQWLRDKVCIVWILTPELSGWTSIS